MLRSSVIQTCILSSLLTFTQASTLFSHTNLQLTSNDTHLLLARQSCPTTSLPCGTGCIPSGGQCCSPTDLTSCPQGYYCYPGGCCEDGKLCSGQGGGCPRTTKLCGLRCIDEGQACQDPGLAPDVPGFVSSTAGGGTATATAGGNTPPSTAEGSNPTAATSGTGAPGGGGGGGGSDPSSIMARCAQISQVPCGESFCMPAGSTCCPGGGGVYCYSGYSCTNTGTCQFGTGICSSDEIKCGYLCLDRDADCCNSQTGEFCNPGNYCAGGGTCEVKVGNSTSTGAAPSSSGSTSSGSGEQSRASAKQGNLDAVMARKMLLAGGMILAAWWTVL